MKNLLSGLDKLGLNPDNFDKIYDESEEKTVTEEQEQEKKAPVVNELEFVFDKTIVCPVCGKEFKTKMVRTGKARLVRTDSDLKPVYSNFEPLKYDIIACLHCGYAATTKSFGHLTPGQIKMIRESIGAGFKGMTTSNSAYTFYEAIDRYKLALANAIAMRGKNSDRAYICLKLAWLYRSMGQGIPSGDAMMEKLRKECEREEKNFIRSAYEGFSNSLAKEIPPICGMDSNTLAYLLADLARRCGDYDNCKAYINMVMGSRSANSKLKERAREEKELLKLELEGMLDGE